MKRFDGLDEVVKPFKHAVVTLGNFDGVHRGHRIILREAVERANTAGVLPVVYTFYPHPVKLFAPESCPPLIQTIDQRLEALEMLGIEACVVESFTLNYAHLAPKEFFNTVLVERLGASAVVIGYDFTFGVHRRGTAEVMQHLGEEAGIEVSVVKAQFLGELLISSTEIRRDIQRGDVGRARELLDAPFALRGTVIAGHGVGSTLGAHTANLKVDNELTPADGVYITHARLLDEAKTYPSITSVGYNPTFKDRSFSVETHIIDYQGNLRGRRLDVLFHKRMRGQVAFDSATTLKGQIERDIETARKWHEENDL